MYDVSTHSRLKAAGVTHVLQGVFAGVSTHSRLKAAGRPARHRPENVRRFNTQPPEGGWRNPCSSGRFRWGFNTQPPEGGWAQSTPIGIFRRGFNTQPPEGGWSQPGTSSDRLNVSTHSRLKAAGPPLSRTTAEHNVSTHSRLKAAGKARELGLRACFRFQHTAA